MRKVTKGFAPLVALALVAAACGGDVADEPSEPPAEETAEEPSEDTAEEPSEDTAEEPSEDTAEEPSEDTAAEEPAAEIATDIGVTDEVIRVGLNADLSGIFAPLVTQIVDGQEAFWEIVNENGGIAGRQVELVILDNAYDVPTHLENYAEMADEGDEGVVFFSQSTGSPHTAATADDLVDDNLIAIPLSWYSGWADPAIGANVMELYTSYCLEAMNGVEYLAGENGVQASCRSRVSTARTVPRARRSPPRLSASRSCTTAKAPWCLVPIRRRSSPSWLPPTRTWSGRRSTRRHSPRYSVVHTSRASGPFGRATRRPGTTSCWPPTSARSPTRCTTTRRTPLCGTPSTHQG